MESNKNTGPASPAADLVDVDEAMRMFGVSRTQLRDWEFAGRICNVRWISLGKKSRGRKLYRVAELRPLVEEMRQAAEVAKRWDRRGRRLGGYSAGYVGSTELTAGDAGDAKEERDAA